MDALEVLNSTAGFADECAAVTDVECDADRDAGDAVEILRQHLGLSPGTPGCPSTGTSLAKAEPDPVMVGVGLAQELETSEEFGPDGGEITATDDDGTVFTLTIPPDALVVEEDVTLTPIESISGLPLSGGLIGGVVIGPEDLVFAEPVTLTIVPGQTPAGPELIGFALSDGEFFLYPLLDEAAPAGVSGQGTPIQMTDVGPGGHGVGAGTDTDVEAQQDHPPTTPADQFSQALDEIFREHERSSPEADAALEAALRQYYLSGLLVALQSAPKDCAVTTGLLMPFLKWLGVIQFALGESVFAAEIAIMQNGLALGVANCFEESYQRCVDLHDESELFYMLKYLGILQSGIAGNPNIDALLGDYVAKIDECTPDPCTGTDCRWVGSAHGEVYYFFPGTTERTFSITVENIIFEYEEDQDPLARHQSYELVNAGPMVWEASGTSGECTVSGTMTLDRPGIDGDYTNPTGREASGVFVEDTEGHEYFITFGGHDEDALFQFSCPEGGGGEQLWPVIPVINSGFLGIPFDDPGTNTIADGEYYDPSEAYGGRWTWDLRKVQ